MRQRYAVDSQSLVFAGGFGVACFVLSFAIGQVMLMATGIPATGGLVAIIPVAFMATIGARLFKGIGFVTIMWLIATALATLTTTYGPPGLYKLLMGFATGATWELSIIVFRRRNLGFVVGSGLGMAVAAVMLFLCMLALGLPAAKKLRDLLVPVTFAYFFLGVIGGFLGLLFFDRKLRHLALVKTLLGDTDGHRSARDN